MLLIIFNNIFIISNYVITNCLKVKLLDLPWFVIFNIHVNVVRTYLDFLLIHSPLEQIRLPNNWSILLVTTMKTSSLIGWLIGIWRPHFLAVTYWWTLIAFHQWLKTIIGTNKIVRFHIPKRQCTLSEKPIEALQLNMCKFKYIWNRYFK